MKNELVIIRGGGDIATGTIYKLRKCGYKVLVLEIDKPPLSDEMWHFQKRFMKAAGK